MTLILSALAPNWVMQASDRRAVRQAVGKEMEPQDSVNKAVFAAERFAFAFTGRVDVDGSSADEWFQLALSRLFRSGMTAEEAFAEVAVLLSGKFSAHANDDANRALTIVGVGWTDDSYAAREPLLVRISNVCGDDGEEAGAPADSFAVAIQALDSKRSFLLDVAGVGLHSEQRSSLEAQIDSLLTLDVSAPSVAHAMLEVIRKEAERTDGLVGRGVMLNSLPRAPGPPDGMIMLSGGWPEPDFRTFAYFHEQDETDLWLAPLVVSSDGSAMRGFEAAGSRLAFPGAEAQSESADMVPGMCYSDPNAPPLVKGAIGQAVRAVPKVGRNDPCWCESGRKYKKCHGR